MSEKYKVVIGMSVTKESEAFADFGLVYSGMGYEDVVKVEAAFAKHSQGIINAMDGLVADLVQMGVDKVIEKQAETPIHPGAIR